jgi:hypothetical protein
MFLLVVVLPVHVSFGRCIVCPCFFWSLYCLSMFLLVVVLCVYASFRKETWRDNTTTKRNMDRQYNDQKKHGQTIQRPKETWTDNSLSFFWPLYCLSFFFWPLYYLFFFFWPLYCLSFFDLRFLTTTFGIFK